jgi:23S rRNA (uracil1939-C5)-methyltransferase
LAIGDRSGKLAWDLYSGVGLFAKALAYDNVIAVESEGFSANDLKTNLDDERHRVIRSGTLDFLRRRVPDHGKPELILVDPPRAGLGKEVCALLASVAAPEIVYVSCDPATLARDLQSLLQSGYSVEKMDLIDLFPQTFHMETVTFLKRN